MNALERAVDMAAKHAITQMVQDLSDNYWPSDVDEADWDAVVKRMHDLILGWDPPPQLYRRAYAYLAGRKRDMAS